jgi:hypothetical protein
MKKLLGSLAFCGLLITQAIASNAVTFDVNNTLFTTTPATDFRNGIQTQGGTFFALLGTGLAPGLPGSGSTISFGQTAVIPALPNTSDSFAPGQQANFRFSLTVNPPVGPSVTRTFDVMGTLTGTVSTDPNVANNPTWNFVNLLDADAADALIPTHAASSPTFVPSFTPNTLLTFGSVQFELFIDAHDQLPNPTSTNPLSVGGFGLVPTVPEPGALALLIGTGMSSSLLVLRRKRQSRK